MYIDNFYLNKNRKVQNDLISISIIQIVLNKNLEKL